MRLAHYTTNERPAQVRPAASYLGTYQGRKVYRFPVDVRLNDSRSNLLETLGTLAVVYTTVDAYSAQDAANAIRAEWETRPETEIVVYGPKGGKTERFIGWYTAIGSAMFGRDSAEPAQVRLF